MPLISLATGAQLDYIDTDPNSTKIPVIAIHGMLGTGELHLQHVIDWLQTEGYRVLAPTMRGYGQSTPKPRDFPYHFYHRDADDVLAFIDVLGIPKTHIIGYSDGGEIALICAGKRPEQFLSASSWGAVGYFGAEMRPVIQRMYPPTWLKQEELELHQIPSADEFVKNWMRSTIHMIDSGGDVCMSLADKITCPVLVMLGKYDTLNPAHYAEKFLEKVQNGRLKMFECGHPVHDDQTEAFRRILGSFMREAENH